jgi:DNA-binding CsgD family transcriptional regulator
MRIGISRMLLLLLTVLMAALRSVANPDSLLRDGWRELIVDNDAAALTLFGNALLEARNQKDTVAEGRALLFLGIGSYGSSLNRGLDYATKAMSVFRSLEHCRPLIATEGRARCLQLISTISERQQKWNEALRLSRAALRLLTVHDSTGTRGLALMSLGRAAEREEKFTPAAHYYQQALDEYHAIHQETYRPSAYIALGRVLLQAGLQEKARPFYDSAMQLAIRTGNRQAQVQSLLGLSHRLEQDHQTTAAEDSVRAAMSLAESLRDRGFLLQTLVRLQDLYVGRKDFSGAWQLERRRRAVQDSVISGERRSLVESLEVQYRLAETAAALKTSQQQQRISGLNNLLLLSILTFLLLTGGTLFYFMHRNARKDQILLQRSMELQQLEMKLRKSQEAAHRQEARRMQSDLEHRESQLSAVTLQMVQKAELLQELRQRIDEAPGKADLALTRIINKGMNQEKDWETFNASFESLNAHFYSRLKSSYPEISPNDLRICALIKMNLSSKEMATILGISPDSVKTARYRLRRKLGLQTEDNLTDFMLRL